MKSLIRCKLFLLTIFLFFSQYGCIVFTLKSPPEGKASFMVQSLTLKCDKSSYNNRIYFSLTAQTERCIDNVPFMGDEVKLAFGLIPGYAKETEREKMDPIGYIITTTVASSFCLGIPVISALVFEPFMSPKGEEELVGAQLSPIGFCKFKRQKIKEFRLDRFRFEYLGQSYSSNQANEAFANVEKGQKIKIKLLTEPVATTGKRLDGMSDFVGVWLETIVK